MERNEVSKLIREILKRSSDFHNVYTPFELCEGMINKFSELNSDMRILVMFNLEFLWVIREKLGKEGLKNVWFLTPCEMKKKAAKNIGVNENQILKYEYNNKTIEGEEKMPKFDVVIGNLPFSDAAGKNKAKKIWVGILEKSLKLINDNGTIGLIIPTNFLLPHHKSFKLINKISKPYYIKLNVGRYFPEIKESMGYFLLNKNITTHKIVDSYDNVLDMIYGFIIPNATSKEESIKLVYKFINNKKYYKVIKGGASPGKGEYKIYSNWEIKFNNIKPLDFNIPKTYFSRLLKRTKSQRTIVSFYDEGNSHILDGYYILMPSINFAKNLSWILSSSKLFRFISECFAKSQYMNPTIATHIPVIDRIINTDQELYEYFNLTKEEIDYIETQIK